MHRVQFITSIFRHLAPARVFLIDFSVHSKYKLFGLTIAFEADAFFARAEPRYSSILVSFTCAELVRLLSSQIVAWCSGLQMRITENG